jgi:hypothetical protein
MCHLVAEEVKIYHRPGQPLCAIIPAQTSISSQPGPSTPSTTEIPAAGKNKHAKAMTGQGCQRRENVTRERERRRTRTRSPLRRLIGSFLIRPDARECRYDMPKLDGEIHLFMLILSIYYASPFYLFCVSFLFYLSLI